MASLPLFNALHQKWWASDLSWLWSVFTLFKWKCFQRSGERYDRLILNFCSFSEGEGRVFWDKTEHAQSCVSMCACVITVLRGRNVHTAKIFFCSDKGGQNVFSVKKKLVSPQNSPWFIQESALMTKTLGPAVMAPANVRFSFGTDLFLARRPQTVFFLYTEEKMIFAL